MKKEVLVATLTIHNAGELKTRQAAMLHDWLEKKAVEICVERGNLAKRYTAKFYITQKQNTQP